MQSLQYWAETLQDPATLQRLRNNLQGLPRLLLPRFDGAEEYCYGHVTGDYNFHFTFRLEGGSGCFQTGVLVASASRFPGGLPVPLRCRWMRRVGELAVEIPGVTSNMYQISADDIGTDVLVEAQCADPEEGLFGVAVGQIGPFELDPFTRRHLDDALSSGGSRFAAVQCRENSSEALARAREGADPQILIVVSADGVRVANVPGMDGREMFGEFNLDSPRVVIHPLAACQFQLVLSDSGILHLAALSRTERDLIALTIRCFHAKRHISITAMLKQLLPVQPLVPGSGVPTPGPGPADPWLHPCIVLERLTKEMNRVMARKDASERHLRNTCHEKRDLQAQLLETISGFTEVIEDLQDQVGDAGAAPSPAPPSAAAVDRLQDQLRESGAQNQALQVEMRGLRQLLDRLVAAREAAQGEGAEALQQEAWQLREERRMLQARLADLRSAGGSSSSAAVPAGLSEEAYQRECERLREDVQTLHQQKERLRRDLQQKYQEREELQKSFLFAKGQMDKIHTKQIHSQSSSSSSSSSDSRDIIRNQERVLDSLADERTQLSRRLDSGLNAAEKEKVDHEQQLERVMTDNARLMREKDRAAREVQRISQLYADSVRQLQVETDRSSVGGPEAQHSGEDEIAKARSDLALAEEALRRREEENESLKSRIRKLAVA